MDYLYIGIGIKLQKLKCQHCTRGCKGKYEKKTYEKLMKRIFEKNGLRQKHLRFADSS